MYEGMGGKEFRCTIRGCCRTQVFEFPMIDLHAESEEPHHEIYRSPSVRACVTLRLVDYFKNSACTAHYAISPPLRHEIGETYENIRLQQSGGAPLFLVIEEFNQLKPVAMIKGECFIVDEVIEEDGCKKPLLIGGREGEQFIVAEATVDGEWPEMPNNQRIVNMILAGVRIGQKTAEPIRKYLDQVCLVTEDGRFVKIMRFDSSPRVQMTTQMDATGFRK